MPNDRCKYVNMYAIPLVFVEAVTLLFRHFFGIFN